MADWYKDAVIYQIHVKSFCDGNGDGIGDVRGLISKLDYLARLGVTALWLLPFYPSPLRDDGYDIANFMGVHPEYGTLRDFKRLLREAHARGLKVITELVLNHTSDQHPWFQRARKAKPGSAARDFYVWSDNPEKYPEARVIFQDFERSNWAWDPVAKAYYWHRFYAHQPDLNLDNPRVRDELRRAVDFWLGLGVDGLRLDAVAYLFEREGTDCENLPETFSFIRELRSHVDERFPGRILLAEANQWPEDAARYLEDGELCHMALHFPLMPRMFMAVETESRYPVIDILEATPEIPPTCQWVLFLRNHDDLTLEMVTDEERDYMYRVYAADPRARVNLGIRRRLAPLLGNDRRKIELMNVLLMTLPGSPVIYYGDEIGMGDNFYLGDRNGVRTPMQWNTDTNAGFSHANPQRLILPLVIDPEYQHASLNVATQENRGSSLLWWMRRLVSLRRSRKCFGRGSIEFLAPDNPKVLAYVRAMQTEQQAEKVLVVANLSRHAQMVELDLSDHAGCTVTDLFGHAGFRQVDASPYVLSLGPYGVFVLDLCEPEEDQVYQLSPAPIGETAVPGRLPSLTGRTWWALLDDRAARSELESHILPAYMLRQRWFGGKARAIRGVRLLEWIPVRRELDAAVMVLVEVDYHEGEPEVYVIPLAFAPVTPESADDYQLPRGSLAWLRLPGDSGNRGKGGTVEGAVYEAVFSRRFDRALLDLIATGRRLGSRTGRLHASPGKLLRELLKDPELDLSPRLLGAEQSNTSIRYGQRLILKLYRRTARGIHPDVEIVRFLTERAGFAHIPAYAGAVEYRIEPAKAAGSAAEQSDSPLAKDGPDKEIMLGILQEFVPNQGDAWETALGWVGAFCERVLAGLGPDMGELDAPPKGPRSLLAAAEPASSSSGDPMAGLISPLVLEMIELLGRRTAELHMALASDSEDPAFAPERFSGQYQRALFQAMHNAARQELRLVRRRQAALPERAREAAQAVLEAEPAILEQMRRILPSGAAGKERHLPAQKIRIHGDYHLGQVLCTGKDFVILDFEGEPSRALSERRIKRSPVRDVAGMVRSFQYAAYWGLLTGHIRPQDAPLLEPWLELWYQHTAGAFLRGYLAALDDHGPQEVVPTAPEDLERLLVPYLLEKAVYEMGYELNNRPDWIIIPLRGIIYLCGDTP